MVFPLATEYVIDLLEMLITRQSLSKTFAWIKSWMDKYIYIERERVYIYILYVCVWYMYILACQLSNLKIVGGNIKLLRICGKSLANECV